MGRVLREDELFLFFSKAYLRASGLRYRVQFNNQGRKLCCTGVLFKREARTGLTEIGKRCPTERVRILSHHRDIHSFGLAPCQRALNPLVKKNGENLSSSLAGDGGNRRQGNFPSEFPLVRLLFHVVKTHRPRVARPLFGSADGRTILFAQLIW